MASVEMRAADLDGCAKEPIHIPGAIQPHGALLAVRERDLVVMQASANTAAFFGRTPAEVLGMPLTSWLAGEDVQQLRRALAREDLRASHPLTLRSTLAKELVAIAHRTSGQLVLEVEPATGGAGPSFAAFYHTVREATLKLQTAPTVAHATRLVTEHVRRITGFDRVMVYAFDADWNGDVLAETRDPAVESYLGLRFPASDIPAQARALYAINWIRLIVDANYTPVPLLRATGDAAPPASPLDLSYATLRSVSPVHLQYMRNMGTLASMSISLMREDRLWGLVSCHDRRPRFVDYQTRLACEFLGQALSQRLSVLAGRAETQLRSDLRLVGARLAAGTAEQGFPAGLEARWRDLLALANAQGAAIVTGDAALLSGAAPPAQDVRELVAWLRREEGEVFATSQLSARFAPAAAYREVASGLLAIGIGRRRDAYLLWFRPEVVETVRWAGDPTKPAVVDPASGALRLDPRRSFEQWKQTVRGMATPWQTAEVDAARDLGHAVVSEELARRNDDLAKSNAELDAFANIASHDLREPLRGIRYYAGFVLEDGASALDAKARERLTAIGGLCGRMESLLTSLYHYSRVGRVGLAFAPTDLNAVVADVRARLTPALEERHAHLVVEPHLPRVRCDAARVAEVFANLIGNAIKYSDRAEPQIAVGMRVPETTSDVAEVPVFFVRDDGIGVPERLRGAIFGMFRRLHEPGAYGGGTGAGLAIVQRILSLHGGRIWVEATPGGGSTFFFTLSSAAAQASSASPVWPRDAQEAESGRESGSGAGAAAPRSLQPTVR